MKQGGIRRRVICWAWHPPICSASLSRHAIRYHLKSVWIIKWLCLASPFCPALAQAVRVASASRISQAIKLCRHLTLSHGRAMALRGDFLREVDDGMRQGCGRKAVGGGDRQLFAPTWRRVGEQQMSRKSWPWLQMPKRAKQIDDKRKRKHSYGRGEREWGRKDASLKHTYQGKFRFGMQMAPARAEVKANSTN